MSSRFVSVSQIVHELRLYKSKDAVGRGWRRGEIPEPKQFGSAYRWNEAELLAFIAEREARRTPKRRRKVIMEARP